MTYATIYWYRSGETAADGLQSSLVCDAAIQAARRIAADHRKSVVVEDRGTEECYRITPSGQRWSAPPNWTPSWISTD